jgi:carbon-monoxide dehydrogenase medium subunit
MKPPKFDYHAPGSMQEAIELLSGLVDLDPKVIAGGQSLVPLMNLRLARPGALIDLRHIDELRGIQREANSWTIGALTRHSEIEDSIDLRTHLPVVPAVAAHIGYRPIRNRGTVGGSLCHADPAAEWPLLARLLDADLELMGPPGVRTVGAGDFFESFFVTAAAEDEILRSVRLAAPPGAWCWGFTEFAHTAGDFAIVAVGAVMDLAEGSVSRARLAAAGLGATPVRLSAAEAELEGTDPKDPAAHRRAAQAALIEVGPSGDGGGSADYKRTLLEVQVRRALAQAASGEPVEVAA